MKEIDLKKNVISGILWKFIENISVQLITFIIQLILARILLPEEFGVIALTLGFIAIANVFINTGFTSALIQKKLVSNLEMSTIFWTNLISSILLYILIFSFAEELSKIFSIVELNYILKIQSLTIIISSINAIHNVILTRELQFKRMFKYRLFAALSQGVVGIALAISGFEIWSLVISNIVFTIIITITTLIVVKWKPQFVFSFRILRELFPFSINVFLISFINIVSNNIQTFLIGRNFDTSILGYYNRGQQFPLLIMQNIDGTINSVMFPALSKYQNDHNKFLTVFRRSLKTSIYIVFPILVGLIIVSDSLIYILLGEKWLSSVPFLIIWCLICMTWPFSIRSNALNAIGKTKVALSLNIFTQIISLILMLFMVHLGIYAFVLSIFIGSIINFIIGIFISKVILNYSYIQQLRDISPIIFITIITGFVMYIVGRDIENHYLKFFLQFTVGFVTYLCNSIIFKLEVFYYLKTNFINKNK